MGCVFFLLGLALMTAVNFLAAQAASTAAQRGLQVAQTSGQSMDEARRVASTLASASGVVTASRPTVSGGDDVVRMEIQVKTVLGSTISRKAIGPRLRFIPQRSR